MRRFVLATAVATALGAPLLLAQEQETEPDDAVVYNVKWRATQEIFRLVGNVLDARCCAHDPALGVLIVRGSAADHALVDDLLNRYDVPPENLEFQLYLVKASPGDSGLNDGVPDDVAGVIAEVGALTRYNTFELIDSPVLRALEGDPAKIRGTGKLGYEVRLTGIKVVDEANPREIRVGEFFIDTSAGSAANPSLFTGFAVPDGGLVVLGASGMVGEKTGSSDDVAIITVIRGRVIGRETR